MAVIYLCHVIMQMFSSAQHFQNIRMISVKEFEKQTQVGFCNLS